MNNPWQLPLFLDNEELIYLIKILNDYFKTLPNSIESYKILFSTLQKLEAKLKTSKLLADINMIKEDVLDKLLLIQPENKYPINLLKDIIIKLNTLLNDYK